MSDIVTLPRPVRLRMSETGQTFPVRRIFCIGRNYADHAKEMGAPAKALFFMKPAEAATQAEELVFPKATSDLHHEVEMVVALGEGGRPVASGVGVDLTRRDRQSEMKERRAPWEIAKAFERSAPISLLKAGPPPSIGSITLSVNGETRQSADLSDMLIPVEGILDALATYFELGAGDLVFTGTPAGVAALLPGDRIHAEIDGLPALTFSYRSEA